MVPPCSTMDPRTETRHGPCVAEAPFQEQVLILDDYLRATLLLYSGVERKRDGKLHVTTKTMTPSQFRSLVSALNAANLQNLAVYLEKTQKAGTRNRELRKLSRAGIYKKKKKKNW